MSLHALATNMASKGRNGDSMLVHMTPGEVHGLQALAMKHGGSLTVNPDTGLPEANFLKSLLPMLAGFALGPAGFGLVSSGLTAGAIVGGVTGLATGSLSKGLMAGLGAYGGFGIGESLAGLGAAEMSAGSISSQMPTLAEGATQAQIDAYAQQVNALRAQTLSAANAPGAIPAMDKVSAGFSSATASPMDAFNFAKDNKMALGMAAAPIMADMMVPTTTKASTPVAPGRIREKRWDGRQFVDVASTDAGVYNTSGRNFSDLYRGYNSGGIVALADGGVPGYAGNEGSVVGGATVTPDEAYKQYIQARNAAALQPGGALTFGGSGVASQSSVDASNAFQTQAGNQALAKLGYSMDQYGNIVSASAPPAQNLNFSSGVELANNAPSAGATYAATHKVDVAGNINKFIQDNPSATADQINTAIKNAGMTQADINPYLTANTNISDAARYALSHANEMPGAGGLAGLNANIMKEFAAPNLTQEKIDTLQAKYGVSDDDIRNPLSGGSQVADTDIAKAANYLATNPDVQAWINSTEGKAYLKANPQFDLNDIAYTHYQRYGKYEGRKWEAPTAVSTVVGGGGNNVITGTGTTTTAPSGYHYENGVLVKNVDATQNTTTDVVKPTDLYTAPATSLPVGVAGNTGPSQIGGGATINPNGTITTSPRIPGIPVGGFAGMQNLRDTYTKGGGSLGYTSPKFDKIEDFNAKYVDKRLTGDSRAAYDYLTGKAGAVYPTKSGFAGQLSQDYATAVLGYPARGNLPYIYNKVTGKMDPNPDYVAPGRDAEGNVTYSMSLNDIKSSLKDTPLSGQALYDWAKSNNLSAQQIADATGRSLSSVYADFRAGSKAAATKDKTVAAGTNTVAVGGTNYDITDQTTPPPEDNNGPWSWDVSTKKWVQYGRYAEGGMTGYSLGGLGSLGGYSDGGRLLKGPGDGVSDSIPATIGRKQQPARLADGEFVVPARIVSELGNGSTDAGAKKLYAMMDRVQRARGKTTGKNKVAANSRADKYLPA